MNSPEELKKWFGFELKELKLETYFEDDYFIIKILDQPKDFVCTNLNSMLLLDDEAVFVFEASNGFTLVSRGYFDFELPETLCLCGSDTSHMSSTTISISLDCDLDLEEIQVRLLEAVKEFNEIIANNFFTGEL